MEIRNAKFPETNFLNTAIERSRKFHVIKYKTLVGRLSLLEKINFFEHSTQNFPDLLYTIKAVSLINYGSDFFWASVHRLSNALDKNDKEETEKNYTYFLQNFFDSFYSFLPDNSRLQCRNYGPEHILLPKLGLALSGFGNSEIIVTKQSDAVLLHTLYNPGNKNENHLPVHLNNIPSFYKIKKETTGGGISVLYQRHSNIFEEFYINDCCNNSLIGHLLKTRIDRSFDIIKDIEPNLYNKIVSSLEYIIPFGNEVEKKYPNFSIATLKKTIFLSIDLLNEQDIEVLESIIHEYSHCELHYIQDTILLTNVDNDILEYYSPWRKDPRPLLGVIHGVYVAHEIICFYYLLIERNEKNQHETDIVRKKTELIIHQLFIAIRQIKKHQLTEFSLCLLGNILLNTRIISEKLSISETNLPEEITNHISLWRSINKTEIQIIQ